MSGHASDRVENLLQFSAKTARAGNVAGARAVVRALARQHPQNVRVWEALAHYAEDPAEQQRARAHLAQFAPSPPPPPAPFASSRAIVPLAPSAPLAPEHREPGEGKGRNPVVRIGMVVLLLLVGGGIIGMGMSGWFAAPAALAPSPPAPLSSGDAEVEAVLPPLPPQPPHPPPAPVAPSPSATPTATPTPTPTPTPEPRPTPTLFALGKPQEYNGWHITLLRSDHTRILSGTVGTLHPHGQLVLALVTVGNGNPTARRIPPGLLLLSDDQGRVYQPVPGASAAYLETYGRGRHGDLALDDAIPPGGSLYSVPLLFDVPPDATGLLLTFVGHAQAGWVVEK